MRDQDECIRTLNRAIDLGCTFWDTANIYGDGANEILLSQVLKTRRSEVFLCTKFAIIRNPDRSMAVCGKPDYVKKCCDESLARLGVDNIDLYYMHRMDPDTPIEETMGALVELKKEGKIKHIGLSEASAATIRRAHKVHPIAAVQCEYSPWFVDIETNGIMDTCKELGIAIVPYSPIGRGFLTGQIKSLDDMPANDYRRLLPRFQGDTFAKNLELVDALEKLAKRKGVTAAQLTLAWVASQGDMIISIPGTTKVSRIEENWAAKDVKITPEDDKAVRDILKSFPPAGERYPAAFMKMVNI
ncbi:hypothetical protein HK101_010187 [Irineochytrium annulatum]|nr:hypothetical protein HK101_010187 [Irineochytrium annulatum]